MSMISYCKNHSTTETRPLPVESALKWIKQDKKLEESVTAVRNGFMDKGDLPAVIWAGEFSRRASDAHVTHSGLMVIDFDGVDDAYELRDLLGLDPHVYSAFISPSGNGVKALIKVPPLKERHSDMFAEVAVYLEHRYQVEVDKSGSDSARLCYLSSDPDIKINKAALTFEIHEDPEPAAVVMINDGDRPGDIYNRQPNVQSVVMDLLKKDGWQEICRAGDKIRLRRPGKDKGNSATLYDTGVFYCFTDGTEFDPRVPYYPFAVYATLEHRGDYREATLALGYNSEELGASESNPEPVKIEGDAWAMFGEMNIATPGKVVSMESEAEGAKYVVGRMAVMGEMTAFYAAPNTGKTLLILKLVTEAVEMGDLKAEDVIYVNADDNFNGSIEKGKLLMKYGIKQIVPGISGRDVTPQSITELLMALVDQGQAKGKIVILDTLKKFVDLMDKRKTRKFNEDFRKFCRAQGTLIGLAHTNKSKNDSGHSVAEGVGDVANDFDCIWVMERMTPREETPRTITFFNRKMRSNVTLKSSFSYDAAEGKTWSERFASVESMSQEDVARKEALIVAKEQYDRDRDIIDSILAYIGTEGVEASIYTITREKAISGTVRAKERILHKYSISNRLNEYHLFDLLPGKTGGLVVKARNRYV